MVGLEKTQLLRGSLAMADLIYWFGFNQSCKSDFNSYVSKAAESNQ